MKKRPIKVKIVGQNNGFYQIQFPNLLVPVTVNEQLYHKMLHSSDYQFSSANAAVKQSFSA